MTTQDSKMSQICVQKANQPSNLYVKRLHLNVFNFNKILLYPVNLVSFSPDRYLFLSLRFLRHFYSERFYSFY